MPRGERWWGAWLAARFFARVLGIFLALVGVGAVITAITLYGDWRSSQTDVGLLTNRTPPGDYVIGMVIAGLVAVAAIGSFWLLWTWRRR